MIDIYNEKLAKYADGERRIFTATFLRPDDRKGIFQNLYVNSRTFLLRNNLMDINDG